jgi:hypothetical protein
MVLEYVVDEVEYGMEISNLAVDEMVDFISTQIDALEPLHRYMFIEWLCAHSSQLQCILNLRAGLHNWFDAMSAECAVWEYRLITTEINWWRDQDDKTLDRLMLDHLRRRK